jgi:hypothetical protein
MGEGLLLKLGAKIFGALSGVLILYLLMGVLLPGTWEAEVDAVVPAPPDSVFPFLNRPDQWVLWNAMPESGSSYVGPAEGAGSGLDWDDPRYGKGTYRVLLSDPGNLVVRWLERGDFGRNPLMGYAARGMAGSQGEAMRANLDSLTALLERRD